MGLKGKIGDSEPAKECAISVGEHVWVSGRRGEYVVMGVDREQGYLQVLRVGRLSGLETVPMKNVRAVLAPKAA